MTVQTVKKDKISALAVTSRDGEWLWFTVGREYNGRIVAAIEDKSCEYENGIDFMYRVVDADGNVIAMIENCATIAEYAKPEKDGER